MKALTLAVRQPTKPRKPARLWLALWRSRRALSRLDPHLLRDVGLTEVDARHEAARPIWDVPSSWRRR